MSGVAILCSGQGAQAADMFDLISEAPEAGPVFAAARRALGGRDPRDLVHQASQQEIHANKVAQVLCCTQALAYWAILRAAIREPLTVVGYSAGELAAWGVAGVIDAATVLDLAVARAALMDEATSEPSGLAAILGLPRSEIEAICRDHDVYVSIVNAPLHFLIGGSIARLDAALAEAERRGAIRTVTLPVDVASHTPLLREASERFEKILQDRVTATGMPSGVRLISGIDGVAVLRVDVGLQKLALQIQQTIDWWVCMDACRSTDPRRTLELGPGGALAHMIGETGPEVNARSVAAFRSIEGIRHWLDS